MMSLLAGLLLCPPALQAPSPAPLLSPTPSPSPSPSAAAAPSPAPSPPALELAEAAASFGEVYEGAVVTHRFPFRNRGAAAVRIGELRPVSPRARVTAHPEVVPPGGEGYVEVEQPTGGRLGVASFRVALRADDGGPERKLALTGFIQSAYDPDQPVLDLGSAAPGGSGSLELFSREVERLEVREVQGAPAFVSADVGGRAGPAREGVVLRLTMRPDAPLGYHTGILRLRTNVEHQPEVPVVWRAGVYEDVLPSEGAVDLGVVREGRPFVKVIRLERRSGGPLEVERIDTGSAAIKAELAPCPRASDSCRSLRLSGVGPAAGSPLGGTLTVVVKGSRPLSLPWSGILVGAETTVKDMGSLEQKAEKTFTLPPAKTPPSPGASAPVVGRPGERRARLTWEAHQEKDTYGYLLYRSDQREGPFLRINPSILRVSPGPESHAYTYVDEQVEPGHTYYYYLESVGRGGTKSRLSGVMAKVIPRPAP
jgi:hypothetical protein